MELEEKLRLATTGTGNKIDIRRTYWQTSTPPLFGTDKGFIRFCPTNDNGTGVLYSVDGDYWASYYLCDSVEEIINDEVKLQKAIADSIEIYKKAYPEKVKND